MDLGSPDLDRARAQHASYCVALERCGAVLTRLPEDPRHPDSTFVEDTAILTPRAAILTRPGAPRRGGEVSATRVALSEYFDKLRGIDEPGTLDGGDVCEAEDRFLIGISERTNEEGARQLQALLAAEGFTSEPIDIRGVDGILHLKSGLSYVGEGRMLAIDALAGHPALRGYEVLPIDPSEAYAANCVRVNRHVLCPARFPRAEATLRRAGYDVLTLEMTEFQKMDGGLSCLSLRF
ncbi:MAG TPA: N(G),N(G)-dimethylarginine dimethylaminohydrolase [Candidatus Polarisedimenticolia bacterium]|nr:N(G),N(G)-dimethylarginine dimethylaminohydrolase [Candidatus Polarisedimenticolia bacterium]